MKITSEDKNLKSLKMFNTIAYLVISFTHGISHISELAVQFYMKDTLKVEPATLSIIMSIIHIPWIIKPLLGLITDLLPLFGYRRKLYIMFCGILNITAWQLLCYFPPNLNLTIALLFCVNIGLSFSTVLGEAVVVELSQLETDKNGAKDYVSLFFFTKYTGALLAAYFKGHLLDIITPVKVFFIASFIPILLVLAGLILKENRAEPSTDEQPAVTSSEKPSLLREFLNFISKTEIFVPICFIIFLMSTPSYSDPFFYFITNELKFTATSLGEISLCATVGTLLAILFYKSFLKNTSFRSIIISGSLFICFFSFMSLALVERLNLKYGVSDFWFCLFTSSFLSMLGELILMPMLSLACVLCPKNLEGTVYALFMSSLNLGSILSNLLGGGLTKILGITSTNYGNLSKLIIISNIYSLAPLPIMFFINQRYFDNPNEKEKDVEDPLESEDLIKAPIK